MHLFLPEILILCHSFLEVLVPLIEDCCRYPVDVRLGCHVGLTDAER